MSIYGNNCLITSILLPIQVGRLAGLVYAEAVKSFEGRKLVKTQEAATRAELKGALLDAVRAGEREAQKGLAAQGEAMVAGMSYASAEIKSLVRQEYHSFLVVSFKSEEAKQEMMTERVAALQAAANVAQNNLEHTVHSTMEELLRMSGSATSYSSGQDPSLAASLLQKDSTTALKLEASKLKEALGRAVAAVWRAELILAHAKAPSVKGDTRPEAEAAQLAAHILVVKSALETRLAQRLVGWSAEEVRNQGAAHGAHGVVVSAVAKALENAMVAAKGKYAGAYARLAQGRAAVEKSFFAAAVKLGKAELMLLAQPKAAAVEAKRSDTAKAKEKAKLEKDEMKKLRTAAGKGFDAELVALLSTVRAYESRLAGEAAVVSGELVGHAKNQIHIKRRVVVGTARLLRLAMQHLLTDPGPASLTAPLRKQASRLLESRTVAIKKKVDSLDATDAAHRLETAKGLTRAAQSLYRALRGGNTAGHDRSHLLPRSLMPPDPADQKAEAEQLHDRQLRHVSHARKALRAAVRGFTNEVVAAGTAKRRRLAALAGITLREPASMSPTERGCLALYSGAMKQELIGALTTSVMLGEGLAKQEDDATASRLTLEQSEHQELEMSQIEAEVDAAFEGMVSTRKAVAKNYASLKAYVESAGSHFNIGKAGAGGFPRKWGSLTDLLMTVWARGKLRDSHPGVGLSMGSVAEAAWRPLFWKTIPPPASSTGDTEFGGLVDEYSGIMADLRSRWHRGLGHYIISQIEESMYTTGLLGIKKQVSGEQVYVNGKSMGLSGEKLAGLDDFAVPLDLFSKRSSAILSKADIAQDGALG